MTDQLEKNKYDNHHYNDEKQEDNELEVKKGTANSEAIDFADSDPDILLLERELKDKIAGLEKQVSSMQDKLLRTSAESDNTRKRLEKVAEETKDYAILSFAKDLLNVYDNLDRALEHKPKNVEGELGNIIAGVEMTRNELASTFRKHGLERVEPEVGEKFDYNLHHAISQIESDEYEQDSVISVMQPGYKLKGKLLRPATVKVVKEIIKE